jgi:UDP-glucose 4-epimerase
VTRAIVTGGAGFIGSHLVDLLAARGYEIVVIDNFATGRRENIAHHADNPRVVVHDLDISDIASVPGLFHGAHYVFHLAGIGDIVPSIERPLEYMRANVSGTLAVLEASRGAGVKKVVYAASSSCYGLASELPTSETATIQAEYPYALSKYMGELAVLHWGNVYRLGVVSIRMFNVYGPRVRTTGAYGAVFGVFLAQKVNGKPFTVVGDGTQTRDFVYVTDVARAFLLAAEAEGVTGEIFNVGAGKPQSVNRLIELIGGDVVHVPKRPGEPDCTWANIAKIQTVLGWSAEVTFKTGVATMLAGRDAWRGAPLWTPEKIADATRVWFEHLAPRASPGGSK